MGMISDCYQLQENQRKNGPLAVKTPPPPALSVRLPCWPAVRRIHPRRSLAPSRAAPHLLTCPPALCLAPVPTPAARAKSSGARSPVNPCGARLPGECRKGTNSSIHGCEDGAQVGAICLRSCAGHAGVSPGRSRAEGSSALLPSCPTPAMHPNAQQGQPLPACQAGRRAKLIFPFRYRKRLSRYNT